MSRRKKNSSGDSCSKCKSLSPTNQIARNEHTDGELELILDDNNYGNQTHVYSVLNTHSINEFYQIMYGESG